MEETTTDRRKQNRLQLVHGRIQQGRASEALYSGKHEEMVSLPPVYALPSRANWSRHVANAHMLSPSKPGSAAAASTAALQVALTYYEFLFLLFFLFRVHAGVCVYGHVGASVRLCTCVDGVFTDSFPHPAKQGRFGHGRGLDRGDATSSTPPPPAALSTYPKSIADRQSPTTKVVRRDQEAAEDEERDAERPDKRRSRPNLKRGEAGAVGMADVRDKAAGIAY